MRQILIDNLRCAFVSLKWRTIEDMLKRGGIIAEFPTSLL